MAKVRQNQIVAVVQGKKARATKLITEAHRGWNKDAIAGVGRTYVPIDDNGENLPEEHKKIHLSVPEKLAELATQMASFYDAVVTQDTGNCGAQASVEVDDKVVPFLRDQPITVLLFLEKQLIDLHTFASQLPVLPADRDWEFDANKNCYVTKPIETIRTQKVPTVIVKYEATDKHPAQTELFNKDVVVGKWTTTHMSSAIPVKTRAEILNRIEKLQDGVKSAREAANSTEVDQIKIGKRLLEHIFGGLISSE